MTETKTKITEKKGKWNTKSLINNKKISKPFVRKNDGLIKDYFSGIFTDVSHRIPTKHPNTLANVSLAELAMREVNKVFENLEQDEEELMQHFEQNRREFFEQFYGSMDASGA